MENWVPPSIRLTSQVLVRVRWVDQRVLDREHPGGALADYGRGNGDATIRLSRDLTGKRLRDTFFHELGHAFSDLVLDNGYGSEAEAQAYGAALYGVHAAIERRRRTRRHASESGAASPGPIAEPEA